MALAALSHKAKGLIIAIEDTVGGDNGSACRIRTYDHSINSRTLYH